MPSENRRRRWTEVMSRSCVIALFALTLASCFTIDASAQQALTPNERKKVKDIICLIKEVFGPCRKTQFRTWTDIPNSEQNYYIFTFGQACDLLSKAVTNGQVCKQNIGGAKFRSGRFGGIDGDKIIISCRVLNTFCTDTRVAKINAKIQLAANLVNEMTHFMQNGLGGPNTIERCYKERDSDRASVKWLCLLEDLLTDDSGDPHTSVNGVATDSRPAPKLVKCLTLTPPLTAAEIAMIVRKTRCLKNGYKRRIECIFDPEIPNGNWSRYYRIGWKYKVKPFPVKVPARTESEAEDEDGGDVGVYVVPPGEMITQSMGDRTVITDQAYVITTTHTTAGNYGIHVWVDVDDDGLPEPGIVSSSQINGPFADPGFDSMGLYSTELPVFATGQGIFFHDLSTGSVWSAPQNNFGGLVGLPTQRINDPTISGGNFRHLFDILEPAPNVVRLVFCAIEPTDAWFGTSVVWFDIDFVTGVTTPQTTPGLLYADALAPNILPDVSDLAIPQPFHLVGNPGATVTVESVGNGVLQTVAVGTVGPAGLSAPMIATPSLAGPDLYRISDGTTTVFRFLPRDGFAIDFANHDETGDAVNDCIDLSTEPARLHFAFGVPGMSVSQHIYELILESDEPDLINNWDNTGRSVSTQDGDIDFIKLAGSVPPLFVQSVADLDGDGNADESVIIRRQQNQPDFFAEIIVNVNSAPMPIQMIPLLNVEPKKYEFVDVDGDGNIDICIPRVDDSMPAVRLMNDGAGNFTFDDTPLYIGTDADFDMFGLVNFEFPDCTDIVPLVSDDLFTLIIESPGGTFFNDPYIVAAQDFTTGNPPVGLPPFGLHLDPSNAFILISGPDGPLGAPNVVIPGGSTHTFLVPPGLSGQSLMTQSLVLTPDATNGFFETSRGIEARFQ